MANEDKGHLVKGPWETSSPNSVLSTIAGKRLQMTFDNIFGKTTPEEERAAFEFMLGEYERSTSWEHLALLKDRTNAAVAAYMRVHPDARPAQAHRKIVEYRHQNGFYPQQ